MKKHLVKIWFDVSGGPNRLYEGLVIGIQRGNKLVIDPNKLFKKAFGYEMPDRTVIMPL